MKNFILYCTIMAPLLLAGCHTSHKETHRHDNASDVRKSEHLLHDHTHDHGSIEHADEISFTKEQAEAVGVTTESIVPGTFHSVIKASGRIQVPQGDEAALVATADGIVSFVNPSISEGIAVKAGESVVTISSKHLQDGDPAAKNKIAFETASKELQRAELLVKDQIISEKEYEQVRLRYETTKTAYDAHASNRSAHGVTVASPISGYIVDRLVSQGDYVSVGQPIATVARNRRMQLRAEVPEKHYMHLRSITSANFKTAYGNRLYQVSDLNGRLVSFGKATGDSFYLPITFEFDSHSEIVPGAYVEVFLLFAPKESVLTIPVSSVTEEQGLFFVYLRLDEECYKKQEVRLGQNDGKRVQVLSGLKEGDQVVVEGVYQVKLAAISSVMPEGHSHSH